MASSTERIRVKLPAGFDPTKHTRNIELKIAEAYGDGFEIDSIEAVTNPDGSPGQVAVATRQVAITQVSHQENSKTKEVRLTRGTKPGDGDKMAIKLADQHGDGWEMTGFEPYLGKAVLTKLNRETSRCRGAISVALGVKPWEVQVSQRKDGGFDLELPRTYVPSKHDSKLEEVATTVVGYDGWYVKVNTQNLTASIIPSAPPTFPAGISTPMGKPIKFEHWNEETFKIPLGMKLPEPGETVGEVFSLNIGAGAHVQVGGLSGAGKLEALENRVPVPVSGRFPSGWATIKDLRIGDCVYGSHGKPVPLDGLSDTVEVQMYDLILSDGQRIRVGEDHLWRASDKSQRVRISNERDPQARGRRFDRAKDLKSLAASVKVGLYGTADDIAKIAGVDPLTIHSLCRSNDISVEKVFTDTLMPKREHLTSVQHFNTREAASTLTATGYGSAGNIAAMTDEWAPAKELLALAGLGRTSKDVEKLKARLRAGGVSEKSMTISVPREGGNLRQSVKTYPVAEVLDLLAENQVRGYGDGGSWEAKDRFSVISTKDMAKAVTVNDGEQNWSIDLPAPLDGPAAELALDPYVLGAWLGDGSAWHTSGVTSADTFIVERIAAAGFPVRRSEGKDGGKNRARTYYFDGLTAALAEAGFSSDVYRRKPAQKFIPAIYLRGSYDQRLALMQGLMDTDGTLDINGRAEFCVTNKALADGFLELARSLGIHVRITEGEAGYRTADGNRKVTGIRYRMHFTTSLPVVSLPRKVERLADRTDIRTSRLYVQDIVKVPGKHLGRCLRIADPSGMYLTAGFVPTHNSVLINCYIAQWLSRGAELCIIDLPTKSADFEWCKEYVRPGGWGCSSDAESATVINLIMEEGERRAKLLKAVGANDWKAMPRDDGFKPIIIVVDELTGLFTMERVPKVSKNSPQLLVDMAEKAERTNFHKELLRTGIKRVAAELRFVGIFLLLASQVASATTGIDPSLRTNLHHKILLGSKPTEGNRRLILSDPDRVPKIPDNVRDDGKAARGTGVAEPEGDEPAVFKTYFATVDQYKQWLEKIGVPKNANPHPTRSQMAKIDDSLEEDSADDVAARRAAMPDPAAALMGDSGLDENGRPLKGAALAAAQTKALKNMSNMTARV